MFIDNLKKIFVKENWRLLILVIWLLIGVAIIQFLPIVGIFIFLPFLTFLMFLFLVSLASRKNVLEYKPWKIILLLILSLPVLLLLSIILIALFAFSIISYFFFTSWFIIYACYLVGRGIDKRLHKYPKYRPFIRTLIFFGGLTGSIMLLYLFIIGPTLLDFSTISTVEVPLFLTIAYIIVGGVIVGLAIFGIVLMFKRIFNAWLGTFFIFIAFYTLFLIVRIYLGLGDTETSNIENVSSIWTTIGMLVVDLLIILYSLSTLMGPNAEMLSKRSKHLGIDTAIIWLIFSKVAYEFIRYFPYSLFEQINIPWINALSALDNDIINLAKNIAVLAFFIILLLVIGIYEIRKYNKEQKELKTEVSEEVEKLISPLPAIKEASRLSELAQSNQENDTEFLKQESENMNNNQND
ncbi:MAG: hypothetical protein JSV62_04790 [Promethearchaeota archaeon]|nr:MAG: hypothetical protein JSV62_04790 [Candidatus Lokiarchaeota archaeon]